MSEDVRAAIAEACRALAADGLVKGTAGNVSVRVEGGIAITATGAVFAQATRDDVSVVDHDGRVMVGSLAPSSELGLHLAAYADDAVGAVVHTHAPAAIALSLVATGCPASTTNSSPSAARSRSSRSRSSDRPNSRRTPGPR